MKRFLIHVSTSWCGMDSTYKAEAKSEEELWDVAETLAYENFESYDLWDKIAREQGYDSDEMTDEDWDRLYTGVDESDYYSWDIEEVDDEEWEEYEGEIYTKNG